jgi:hypothetical protein
MTDDDHGASLDTILSRGPSLRGSFRQTSEIGGQLDGAPASASQIGDRSAWRVALRSRISDSMLRSTSSCCTRRRRADQDQAVQVMSERPTPHGGMFHVVTIRYSCIVRMPQPPIRTVSLFTDHMLASHPPVEVRDNRQSCQSHGSTSKCFNHRFTEVASEVRRGCPWSMVLDGFTALAYGGFTPTLSLSGTAVVLFFCYLNAQLLAGTEQYGRARRLNTGFWRNVPFTQTHANRTLGQAPLSVLAHWAVRVLHAIPRARGRASASHSRAAHPSS